MDVTKVILVNTGDEPVGAMEKMEAHQKGILHRAFSIFIFNSKGEMLLQQRAATKYHSGGLWTNACCSHPCPGEDTAAAAGRRLNEELGFTVPLEKIFDFVYRTEFDNGLTEHEFDHVFAGEYNERTDFNPAEVMNTCYKKISEIKESLQIEPEIYTSWFNIAFPQIEAWWNKEYNNKVS